MPINSFLYPGAKVVPVFTVANSLRFNDGDSHYLTRTNSSTGSTSKSTISLWIKRGVLGTYQDIFESYSNNDNYFRFRFRDDDKMDLQSDISNSTVFLRRTTRVFRDPSAWMHICVKIDLTQSNSDKIKLFINGTQETTFDSSTDLTSSSQQFVGAGGGYNFTIGRHPSDAAYFDGYMAEYVFIDGQALDPTSFGEYDDDTPNVWKPIDVSGLTFGTNGFYLDFEDSSALGNDVYGVGDFTPNNFAATDQSTDTCTNNFSTFNSAQPALSNTSFSEGNLVAATNSSASTQVPFATTIPISTGKFYAEFKMIAKSTTSGSIPYIGVLGAANFVSELNNAYFVGGANLDGVGYGASGVVYSNGSELDSSEASYDTNDIIGVAADITNKKIYFSKNGTYINSGDPAAGSNGYTIPTTSEDFYIFAASLYGASGSWGANFGSPSFSISSGNSDANGYGNFEYAVPSGYYALNTKNLAEFG